jgi:hypothetical protein
MALEIATKWSRHAAAQSPPDEKSKLQKVKDELRQFFQRPSSGRTTALGRKVEKPGSGRPGGPSGQTDGADHDCKHANK